MNWKRTALLILVLVGVAAGSGYVQYLRGRPKPHDYVKTAMSAPAVGKTSNSKLLLAACGTVEWTPVEERDGGYVVEARGTQGRTGKAVVVRWQVHILRDGNVTSFNARPLSASVGGEELDPPGLFVERLGAAAKGG